MPRKKYHPEHLIVEAIEYDGENSAEIEEWVAEHGLVVLPMAEVYRDSYDVHGLVIRDPKSSDNKEDLSLARYSYLVLSAKGVFRVVRARGFESSYIEL